MNYKAVVRRSKIRRVLASVPSGDLLATLTAIAAVFTIGASIVGGTLSPETKPYFIKWNIAAACITPILFAVLAMKTWLEYKRRKSDPEMVLQFQKEFDETKDLRKEAATICMEFLKRWPDEGQADEWPHVMARYRHPLEDVLDFFEDVGFYLNGEQFSDDVAHHHFFHRIRGWSSVLKPFIEFYRREDDAAYIHVEILHGRTCEIEKKYKGAQAMLTTKEDKIAFLEGEGAQSPWNAFADYLSRFYKKS